VKTVTLAIQTFLAANTLIEQVHVVFSFVGPLFVINGIGFLILGIYEFREANKYA